MGPISRILGTGLGLASEAIHAHRNRSRSRSRSEQDPAPVPPPQHPPDYEEGGVVVVAVADQHQQHQQHQPAANTADGKSPKREKGEDNGDGDGDGDSDNDSDTSTDIDEDEAVWELDEMSRNIAPPSYDESEANAAEQQQKQQSEAEKAQKEEDLIAELLKLAGPVPVPPQRLPCSVVIPQRRPRQKDRGFVRAYAPVLKDCGIGQETFLRFLKSWQQASKASPWIDVVFISAGIAGFVPSVTAMAVSTVVQVVAGTAREIQSRHRRNTFLDRVNQDLFMPRGLYALIMAFKDDLPRGANSRGPLSRIASQVGTLFAAERLDINQTVLKYSDPDPEMSKLKKTMKDIRLTSGKTVGQLEMPEAAELIFPDIDRAAFETKLEGKQKETTKEKWKGAGKFVQGYLDHRAQAKYAHENPGSSLAVTASSSSSSPQSSTTYVSRFSDPSHPANSGSLISLLTGGAVNPAARRQARRQERDERRALKREYKDARRVARGRSARGPRRPRLPRNQRKGIIRKVLQQDVLYLLIVNLPTEQEVSESVGRLERTLTELGNAAYQQAPHS